MLQSDVDTDGNVEYCFLTQDGIRSPVLHVYPVRRYFFDRRGPMYSYFLLYYFCEAARSKKS